MDNNILYKLIENYVIGLFHSRLDETLAFHNLHHTQNVVKRTREIAGHYSVSEQEMLVLHAAAWFHDTGHLFTDPAHHEVMSADVMRKFMMQHTKDEVLINETEQCIMATKPPRNPATLLQQILCDADTYHLGTEDFKETNKRARKEHKLKGGILSKTEFNAATIGMLESHQFYTAYCRDLLTKTKLENMKKLKNKIEEEEKEEKKDERKDEKKDEKKDERKDVADKNPMGELSNKDKAGLMSKGIQTMLRLTSENHLKLSDMADNKANILISVNAIIISVILGVLLRKLEDSPYLTIPSVIFLAVALTTIVISIIATRPKISGGTFSDQDVEDKKINLLFFGNFHRTSFEKYDVAMRKMMNDSDYLYGALIRDIFSLGTVLGRKYKLINLAYNIFMFGLILSVFAFAMAVYIFHGGSNVVNGGNGSPL